MVMNTQRMRRYDTTTRRWYGCSDAQGGWTHPMIRCQGTSRVHRRWRTNRPTRHKAPVATSPSKVNPGTDLLGWTLGTILVAIHHFLRVTRKGFKKPNSMNLGWHQVCLNQKKSGDYRSGRYVSDWISFLWCPPFNVFVGRSPFRCLCCN